MQELSFEELMRALGAKSLPDDNQVVNGANHLVDGIAHLMGGYIQAIDTFMVAFCLGSIKCAKPDMTMEEVRQGCIDNFSETYEMLWNAFREQFIKEFEEAKKRD